MRKSDIEGLVQDCGNSSALAMELLQSCIKPSLWSSEMFFLISQLMHSDSVSGITRPYPRWLMRSRGHRATSRVQMWVTNPNETRQFLPWKHALLAQWILQRCNVQTWEDMRRVCFIYSHTWFFFTNEDIAVEGSVIVLHIELKFEFAHRINHAVSVFVHF